MTQLIRHYINKMFFWNSSSTSEKRIVDGVKFTLKNYHNTLKDLEEFDKGHETKTYRVAKNKPLRKYLQHLQ